MGVEPAARHKIAEPLEALKKDLGINARNLG